MDEAEGTVELQHFDGDLEEMDIDDWQAPLEEKGRPVEGEEDDERREE